MVMLGKESHILRSGLIFHRLEFFYGYEEMEYEDADVR